jgi:hypothetical protein
MMLPVFFASPQVYFLMKAAAIARHAAVAMPKDMHARLMAAFYPI